MPPAIRVEVIPDRTEVRLSESLRVEVRIQGPAPLRLDLPKQWLAESSAEVWKIEPLGKPVLADVPDGGQTWNQSFQLDPYLPGAPLPLTFSPVKVNDLEVNLPSFSITVTTTVRDAKVEDARPITGIEMLPPKPVTPATNYLPWLIAGIAVAAVFVVLIRLRRPKPVPQPAPGEWIRAELAKLSAGSPTFAEGLAAILRGYISRVWSVPAENLTTAELRETKPELEPFWEMLDHCDHAKYAGETMSASQGEEMRQKIRFILNV